MQLCISQVDAVVIDGVVHSSQTPPGQDEPHNRGRRMTSDSSSRRSVVPQPYSGCTDDCDEQRAMHLSVARPIRPTTRGRQRWSCLIVDQRCMESHSCGLTEVPMRKWLRTYTSYATYNYFSDDSTTATATGYRYFCYYNTPAQTELLIYTALLPLRLNTEPLYH